MPYKYCNHIKENGTYCRSAALRGRNYCYYHARLRARRLAMAQAKAQHQTWHFEVPALEDMASVQAALMQLMEALSSGLVDPQRARLLLDALRQASTNLRSNVWLAPSRYEIAEDHEFRAPSYSALEAEFSLPKRINIDTPPEVAFPAPQQPAAADEPQRVAKTTASAKKPAAASAAKRPQPVAIAASATARSSSANVWEADAGSGAGVAKRPPASVKLGSPPASRAAQPA